MQMLGPIIFVLVIMAGLLIMQPFARQYVETYEVRRRTKKVGKIETEETHESAILAMARFVGELALRTLPALADRTTTTWLMQAGYRTPEDLATFIGIKVLVAATAMISLGMMAMASGNVMGVVLSAFAGFMGWIIPNFMLTGRVAKRKRELLHELPTVIDLLIVCAQAGLGLLMCIDKVCKETEDTCPVLASEFRQFINDVKIFSKPSQVALADMSERCGLDPLSALTSSLIAAEAKGSDISYPLKQQAVALRDKLKRSKEEEAAKVPVKMVGITVIFILPCIMCPLLGPAAMTLMTAFGSMSGK